MFATPVTMSKPGPTLENESDKIIGNEKKKTKLKNKQEKEEKCVKDDSGFNREILETRKPRRTINLPYGCVWSGKERRFAIRVVPPKHKNGL